MELKLDQPMKTEHVFVFNRYNMESPEPFQSVPGLASVMLQTVG